MCYHVIWPYQHFQKQQHRSLNVLSFLSVWCYSALEVQKNQHRMVNGANFVSLCSHAWCCLVQNAQEQQRIQFQVDHHNTEIKIDEWMKIVVRLTYTKTHIWTLKRCPTRWLFLLGAASWLATMLTLSWFRQKCQCFQLWIPFNNEEQMKCSEQCFVWETNFFHLSCDWKIRSIVECGNIGTK